MRERVANTIAELTADMSNSEYIPQERSCTAFGIQNGDDDGENAVNATHLMLNGAISRTLYCRSFGIFRRGIFAGSKSGG
jgi:hypothetical protein